MNVLDVNMIANGLEIEYEKTTKIVPFDKSTYRHLLKEAILHNKEMMRVIENRIKTQVSKLNSLS